MAQSGFGPVLQSSVVGLPHIDPHKSFSQSPRRSPALPTRLDAMLKPTYQIATVGLTDSEGVESEDLVTD